jgi:4'-phosphopantetheinyl transferase EntD
MNISNPAKLSRGFESLFPPGVIAAELDEPGRVELLLPEEAAGLGRAVPERQQEFAAGRLCARRALAELGIVDFAVIALPDRQPRWPATIVGSIAHTAGLCAAVAGLRSRFAGLGVDTEIAGRVSAELSVRICVDAELAWIGSLPAVQRAPAAAIVFAAKEAFYKCQSPITGQWLGFKDLKIEPAGFDGALREGTVELFRIVPSRPIALTALMSTPLAGRYRFHREFVSAGVAIEA